MTLRSWKLLRVYAKIEFALERIERTKVMEIGCINLDLVDARVCIGQLLRPHSTVSTMEELFTMNC